MCVRTVVKPICSLFMYQVECASALWLSRSLRQAIVAQIPVYGSDCPRVEYNLLSPLRASIAVRMQQTVCAAFVSIVSLYTNASCNTKISTKTLETHSVETYQTFLPRLGRSGRKTGTNVWHAFGCLTRANAHSYGRTCG